MQKAEIPRLELETFTSVNFKVPFLNVDYYQVGASYFIIKNREDNPVKDYISPNRRQFYKIFHIASGTGILTVGLHQYLLKQGDIAFLHPDEIMSWQTTSSANGGHFCLIHPRYFDQAEHVLQLFRNYAYFKPSIAVVQLSGDQSKLVNRYFEFMLNEEESNHHDKKQAILLHLQMILLEAQRAGKTLADMPIPHNYRYIHGFLTLLESAFQIQGPGTVVKTKTAAEFADQLNVHPNYLNSLVKNQTGKTLREHIQARLLYEAKVLLTQTNWDVSTISHVLGFSEHAAFTSLFHKKVHMAPSIFRDNVLNNGHV
ncbi:AraC family transcriptional regulator [Pedobacter frigidisoli]|uniref:AraC family transcriptional regulator n=1 Tax=Pedobacter frigidisoli TaxID=2530455 RepID=A0A4R0NF97_9SPHI|nr:AraC family transcriptional regulator [Pedobacter frigidisoli]TCC97963.1 AraC family transcriptional regulator [Pedobacter frigidisoli]